MNRIGCVCVFLLALVLGASPSQAQSGWPGGPISIVVPYAAGGITDTLARIVAERLSARLGVSVIADNRAGAGGVIAAQLVAGAKPDGRPVIFLGYVVTEPWGENFKIITATGFQDSAPHYLDRWCQYIFFKNLKKLQFKNRSVGKISDTEFQWARFSLLDSAPV